MWQRFCTALGLTDLAADPSLADNAGRRAGRARITEQAAAKLQGRTAAEWLRVFGEIDVPASLVQTLSEVVKDPQVVARGSLMNVPDSADQLVTVHSPFRLATVPPRNQRFPDLGEHSREVLLGLGYEPDDVDALIASDAVVAASTAKKAQTIS
jgi:crotonobetainyl-CoA:carnitine CoA-transferase CaiB-like acyl-CoA transferase